MLCPVFRNEPRLCFSTTSGGHPPKAGNSSISTKIISMEKLSNTKNKNKQKQQNVLEQKNQPKAESNMLKRVFYVIM